MEENLKSSGEIIIYTSDKVTHHEFVVNISAFIRLLKEGYYTGTGRYYPYHSIVAIDLVKPPHNNNAAKESLVNSLILN